MIFNSNKQVCLHLHNKNNFTWIINPNYLKQFSYAITQDEKIYIIIMCYTRTSSCLIKSIHMYWIPGFVLHILSWLGLETCWRYIRIVVAIFWGYIPPVRPRLVNLCNYTWPWRRIYSREEAENSSKQLSGRKSQF